MALANPPPIRCINSIAEKCVHQGVAAVVSDRPKDKATRTTSLFKRSYIQPVKREPIMFLKNNNNVLVNWIKTFKRLPYIFMTHSK